MNRASKKQIVKSSALTDIFYIRPQDITFWQTKGNLLAAKSKTYEGRVNLLRIFPLTYAFQYLSVKDDDFNELGVIEDARIFSPEQFALIEEELSKRYFVPSITKVNDVREEFGNYFWECETTSGNRSFTVRDLANNLLKTKDGGLILIDTDGNRYGVKELKQLGTKAARLLDIWL